MTKTLMETTVGIIQEIGRAPYVDVCCGSGWLVSSLRGNRIGVDPVAPKKSALFYRKSFETFFRKRPTAWEKANTIIMCDPPGPFDPSEVVADVIDRLLGHHTLIIVCPKPYESAIVAGTVTGWWSIFNKTTVSKIVIMNDIYRAFILRPGDGVMAKTKETILNGHSFLQLNGVHYYNDDGSVIDGSFELS